MKFLILLIVTMSLYGATPSKETCYTVQLLSKSSTEKNKKSFENSNYPKSCRIMEIGKSLTIRCGCVEKKQEARKILKDVQPQYKQAIVMTTYSYRFKDNVEKKKPIKIIKPIKKIEKPIKIKKEIVQKKEKKVKKIKKIINNEELNSSKVITSSFDEDKVIIIEHTEEKKVKKIKVLKKRKKKKRKKIKIKKEKKVKKERIKKEKSKKIKKIKYVKKRAKRHFYDKYINLLESKKGYSQFDYKYRFGAQFSYDMAYVNEADISYDEDDWRRIRAFHKGSFFDETLFYEIEYSFLGEGAYKDVLIGYENNFNSINTEYRVKIGNIKIPFSLETYTSSKYTMFMERSLNDAFSMGRKLGGELLLSTKLGDSKINLFLATFTNSINEKIDSEVNMPGYATRLTYAYKINKNHLLSLGGAFLYQDIKEENIKFKQGAESKFILNKYVATKVKNIYNTKKTNMEFLYINNKFSIQSEYSKIVVDSQKDIYSFDAYYIQGSYFLLGNGRKYKFNSSTLGNVKPLRGGALEVAFRYDYINLSDDGKTGLKPENGGTQIDYTYGLNWYLSKEFKVTLNYIVAQPDSEDYDGLYQVVQARALFAF